ncbi:MAG: nucleotidyl transferase AbiEii/AbiGii toxin family protein [Candidatus Moranbacteria bacterium]|nr:nucleotidyl transferase AbiEii/AbiGii toxin family protein [Candidatus Moranbacteria bacterium]
MHKEILSQEQVSLFPLLERFGKEFGLVGGTAVALHLGHRRSIDFDLFSKEEFANISLERNIRKVLSIERMLVNRAGELTFMTSGVKVTFFCYPFRIEYADSFERRIPVPDLLTLAAMKAFAIGKRAKWKDYVDLYFILKDRHSFQEVSAAAKEIFGSVFNEKIFRTQLAYFDDINYDEAVEFMPGYETDDDTIKETLIRFSLS